jgi:hypothetical protein
LDFPGPFSFSFSVSVGKFVSVAVADNCSADDALPEPGGGRKTPVPGMGTGRRAEGCLGEDVGHPVETGGMGTGAGNGIGAATGVVMKSGCTPFGGGI